MRIGFEIIKQYFPKGTKVYTSTPTYGGHDRVIKALDLPLDHYTYFDFDKNCLNFEGMYNDIKNAPEKSVIVL